MTEIEGDTETSRRLIWHGVLLFLLGLLTGFVVPALANPRMGLTSHLEGLMNGMFLILMGLIWMRLRASHTVLKATFGLFLFGAYANWLATLLAAYWGAGASMPIAAQGHVGEAWQEAVIMAGLVALSTAMVVGTLLVLWSLRGRRQPAKS